MIKVQNGQVRISSSKLVTKLFEAGFEILSQEREGAISTFVIAVPDSKMQSFQRIMNGL